MTFWSFCPWELSYPSRTLCGFCRRMSNRSGNVSYELNTTTSTPSRLAVWWVANCELKWTIVGDSSEDLTPQFCLVVILLSEVLDWLVVFKNYIMMIVLFNNAPISWPRICPSMMTKLVIRGLQPRSPRSLITVSDIWKYCLFWLWVFGNLIENVMHVEPTNASPWSVAVLRRTIPMMVLIASCWSSAWWTPKVFRKGHWLCFRRSVCRG